MTPTAGSLDLELEEPSAEFRESYCGLVREFEDAGEPLVPFPLSFPHQDFDAFLKHLSACKRGEGLPPGFVPHSTYWLVLGGAEVVGVSNLRHELTEALRRDGGHIGYGVRPSARRKGYATELLRQTLARASAMGLSDLLLICERENEPSARTILRNGGVLESEDFLPERSAVVQRFWITLDRGSS